MLDEKEFDRWIAMSQDTLKSAENDLKNDFFNWACFKAQQAAEFSIKALIYGIGYRRGGHSITALLKSLSDAIDIPERIFDLARSLDKLYIPTRYPDAWSEGSPKDYYSYSECEEAIKKSREFIEWVLKTWESLKKELEKENK